MIDELLKLSKIFKDGFTVEIKEGKINQYTNYNKPYIVSHKTIIEITDNSVNYKNIDNLSTNCIIEGWLDIDTNTYYIEVNKTFILKSMAIAYAQDNNQKAIYDIRTGEIIEV